MLSDMAESCWRFRVTMIICLVSMVGTFLVYLSMLPTPSDTPYGTNIPLVQPEEAPHSRGLYKGSSFVDELNQNTYNVVMRSKSPTAVLYYASWCGHCRHFVKPYTSLAEKSLIRINDLNSAKSKKKGKYELHFTAIDCAEFSSICSKADVRSYPTLMAYRSGKFEGKVVGATEKEASALINKVYFQAALAAEDSNTTQISTAIEEGDVLPSMMLSYQAGPKERFTDALTSLDYLLVNELPRTWTEGHRATMVSFLTVLVALFPHGGEGLSQRRQLYERILEIVQKDEAPPHKFLTDKVKTAVKESPLYSSQWQVCGVVRGLVTSSASTSGGNSHEVEKADQDQSFGGLGDHAQQNQKLRRNSNRQRIFSPHRIRDHAQRSAAGGGGDGSGDGSGSGGNLRGGPTHVSRRVDAVVNSLSNSSTVNLSPAPTVSTGSGYTCGLWFLFHYLTVAAGEASYANNVSATQLMESIRDLVRDFFSCHECREHFLQAYEDCRFGRCNITSSDYSQLQMWFFHQHNAVTHSKFSGKAAVTAIATPAGGADRDVLWPSAAQCTTCVAATAASPQVPSAGTDALSSGAGVGAGGAYDPSAFETAAVLTYLREAYLP